jgi:hypothetical protein
LPGCSGNPGAVVELGRSVENLAVAASYLPARAAAQIDPMAALRIE